MKVVTIVLVPPKKNLRVWQVMMVGLNLTYQALATPELEVQLTADGQTSLSLLAGTAYASD